MLQRAGRQVAGQISERRALVRNTTRTLVRAESEMAKFAEAEAQGHVVAVVGEGGEEEVPYWLHSSRRVRDALRHAGSEPVHS